MKTINGDAEPVNFSTKLKLMIVEHVAILNLGRKKFNSDIFICPFEECIELIFCYFMYNIFKTDENSYHISDLP